LITKSGACRFFRIPSSLLARTFGFRRCCYSLNRRSPRIWGGRVTVAQRPIKRTRRHYSLTLRGCPAEILESGAAFLHLASTAIHPTSRLLLVDLRDDDPGSGQGRSFRSRLEFSILAPDEPFSLAKSACSSPSAHRRVVPAVLGSFSPPATRGVTFDDAVRSYGCCRRRSVPSGVPHARGHHGVLLADGLFAPSIRTRRSQGETPVLNDTDEPDRRGSREKKRRKRTSGPLPLYPLLLQWWSMAFPLTHMSIRLP